MHNQWSRFSEKFVCILTLAAAVMTSAGAEGKQPGEKIPAEKERFAFLVGVDHYQDKSINNLRGPGNDVKLFQHLLVSRYKFTTDEALPVNQRHIATLIGADATRQAIIDGFRSQLIENARKHPGAVVVFYFSGHGSTKPDVSGTNGGVDHMTIVPSDRGDSILDITDDEINGWFEELRQYTHEITFVLDSCHSGSATKAPELVTKEAPPQKTRRLAAVPAGSTATVTRNKTVDKGFINPNDVYAAIYSSLRYELSSETDLPDDNGRFKRNGVLTYYLVKTLESNPDISYDEAVNHLVSDRIKGRYGQHPEVEGNLGKPVFGADGDWEDPFLKITRGPAPDKTFSINGGEILGIQKGTYLAIYKASAKKLVGEKDKLANAQVIATQNGTASARLVGSVKGSIPANSKVVVVTPNFGSLRLRVDLQASKMTGLSDDDRSFMSGLVARLKDSPLVTITDPSIPSENKNILELQLQRGCIDSEGKLQAKLASSNLCQSPAYYITTPASNDPVFDFWIAPSDTGSNEIAAILEQYAKQENLRALSNARSGLKGAIELSLVRVNVKSSDGDESISPEEDVVGSGTLHMQVGQRFRMKIKNTSKQSLDVVVFALGTAGSVRILNRRGVGEEVKGGATWKTDRVFIFSPPLGVETYKVMAYSHPDDAADSPNFRTLEMMGASKATEKDLSTPLGWLVNQAGTGRRETGDVPDIDLSSWTVAQMNVVIDP